MPSTTNFGWTTPADTDLVKDGASAIRTLGNGIDTTLVDLKGGTTGQVLSKNSNSDMDFTWVAQDDSNAIQNAIVDAKGDLISATAADTPARLAVGTDGQVLTADSAETTGLKWATPTSGSMTLLSTTTLSGSSTTVSSISQSYESLLVVIRRATWTSGNGTVYCKPNNTANLCSFIGTYWQAGTGNSGSSATDIQSYLNTTNSSSNGFAVIRFYRYANTSDWKNYDGTGGGAGSGGSNIAYVYGGVVATNDAITSLNFYPSSGANFNGGSVLIYGVK